MEEPFRQTVNTNLLLFVLRFRFLKFIKYQDSLYFFLGNQQLNIKVKIAVGIIIFIVVLFIGSFVYYKQGIKAKSSKNKEVFVTIPKGSSGNDIIKILDKNKLIKSFTCAKIYLKMNQHDFKSNVYILNKKMDLKTIFKAIEGKDKKYISNTKITVLDGQTIPEYASIISKQTGIDYNEIIQKWTDQTYLQKLIKKYWFLTDDILSDGIYYPLEGYLAPETYFLTQEDTIESITKMMLSKQVHLPYSYIQFHKLVHLFPYQNDKIQQFHLFDKPQRSIHFLPHYKQAYLLDHKKYLQSQYM